MNTIIARLLPLLALFVFGCQNGQTVVRYDPFHPVPNELITVSQDGNYGLFAEGEKTPISPGLFALSKGDRLGFIRRMGNLAAVAGNYEFQIVRDTAWTWRRVGPKSSSQSSDLQSSP